MVALLYFLTAIAAEPDDPPDPEPTLVDEVTVEARKDDLTGIATSATDGATGAEDLRKRPILRAGEIVETVPGVIATQHSGGGKANQYFLRGFNLDHGTDLRLSVDGMQVNPPTHAHGHADLNFLIPRPGSATSPGRARPTSCCSTHTPWLTTSICCRTSRTASIAVPTTRARSTTTSFCNTTTAPFSACGSSRPGRGAGPGARCSGPPVPRSVLEGAGGMIRDVEVRWNDRV